MMRQKHSSKAQSMLEFALVFPVLILLIYGIVELGRMLFIYSAVTSASREAARWGSATGPGLTANTPKYNDCLGIRTAARKSAILMPLPDSSIIIHYDGGPTTTDGSKGTSCPAASVSLGDRVVVAVSASYAPIMPVPGITGFDISVKAGRTIMKDIQIKGNPPGGGEGGGGAGSPNPKVSFSTAAASAEEDDGAYSVNVVLDATPANDVTVNISVGGTAVQGTNFTYGTTSVTIPAGSLSAAVTINLLQDHLYTMSKTVVLTLGSPTNATVGSPNPFTLTITNVDPPPVVRFQAASSTITETNGSAAIAVRLTDAAGSSIVSGMDTQITFGVGGTAVLGTNYNLSVAPLIIPAGQGIGFLVVTPLNDATFDPDLTVVLTLQTATNVADGTSATLGAPTSHTLTIKDNNLPKVYFKAASLTVQKSAGTATVQVVMDTPSTRAVSVPFSVSGTAVSPAQYSIPTASPVTFGAGVTSVNITINLVNTATPQGDKTVILTLGTPTLNVKVGSPNVFTLTIQDVYTAPTAYFSASSANVNEGQAVTLNVLLSGFANAAVTIPINLAGTAIKDVDYTASPALPATITIPLGQLSASLTFTTLPDGLYEGPETIILTMGTPAGGSVTKGSPNVSTISVLDSDPMPTVYFNGVSNVVAEDAGVVSIPVKLSGKTALPVTVQFEVESDKSNAVVNVDYNPFASYIITFPANTLDATLNVSVKQNPTPDLNPRNLVIKLESPVTQATIGSPAEYTLTIRDNQVCPRFATITPDRVNKKLTLFLANDRQYATLVTITNVSVTWSGDNSNRTQTVDWLDATPADSLSAGVKSGVAIAVAWPHTWTLATSIPPAPAAGYRLLFTFKSSPVLNATFTVSITYSNNCIRTTTAIFNP